MNQEQWGVSLPRQAGLNSVLVSAIFLAELGFPLLLPITPPPTPGP